MTVQELKKEWVMLSDDHRIKLLQVHHGELKGKIYVDNDEVFYSVGDIIFPIDYPRQQLLIITLFKMLGIDAEEV